MKRSKYLVALFIAMLFIPLQVFAAGSVTTNKSVVNVVEGSSSSFTIKATNAAGKVTITSSDTSIATVSKSSTWVENESISISVKGKKVGTTTIKVVVDAATFDEEVIKKTYTIKVNVTEPKSTNNRLSSLNVTPGDIDFEPGKTNYTVVVDNDVDEVKITAKASSADAKVTGTGVKKLEVYENEFNVVVTAENGAKKTYTITVKRKDKEGNDHRLSTNANLSELTIEGYDFAFDDSKDTFYYNVDKTTEELKINAVPADKNATVTITGAENIAAGENIITITVTAEARNKKTYKLIVTRDDGVPRVTIDKLLETIETTDSNTIIVNIYENDSNIITGEMLNKLENKKLIINKWDGDKKLYTWEINGDDVNQYDDIDTFVEFYSNSDKEMNHLTNYAKYLYFNNHLNTSLFTNIKLKIYVDDEYSDDAIYGYTVIDNNLDKVYENLKYENGYIEIDNIHMGTALVSQTEVHVCIYKIIAIIEYIIIMIICVFAIYTFVRSKNKEKKKKKSHKKEHNEEKED